MQILTPYRTTGDAAANQLNAAIQKEVNPPALDKPEVSSGGRLFRLGDRVMQTKNDYDIALFDRNGEQVAAGVFNGEVGIVSNAAPGTVTVNFDGRYAEYPLIVPMLPAHKILLSRNLFYTAITRAKRRVVLVGMKKAIHMAVAKCGTGKRNTLLGERIRLYYQAMTRRTLPGSGEELKNAS